MLWYVTRLLEENAQVFQTGGDDLCIWWVLECDKLIPYVQPGNNERIIQREQLGASTDIQCVCLTVRGPLRGGS